MEALILKERGKKDELVRRFGRGNFDYIGNSLADLPIFEQAATAIYGGQSFMLRVRLMLVPGLDVLALDDQPSLLADSGLLPLVLAFRLTQWFAALLILFHSFGRRSCSMRHG